MSQVRRTRATAAVANIAPPAGGGAPANGPPAGGGAGNVPPGGGGAQLPAGPAGGGGGGAPPGGGGGGGGGGVPPAAGGGAVNPPPQIFFIASPWQGDLDLNTKRGKALWDEGIRPLETKFSGYGKDLPTFLASVSNQVNKCLWTTICTINGHNLLTQYGEISRDEVVQARDTRDAVPIVDLATARPKTNALMMYHFIYDSLDETPRKKLSTKLSAINQDGPLLLKTVLDNTYIATMASTYIIKERFYDLNLKKYKWNVHRLNQDVREKTADPSDPTNVIISLFRAYSTGNNEEFNSSVMFWKNEWTQGIIQDVESLMERADAKYDELKNMGTWGKKSAKDEQIVALTAKVEELSKGKSSTTSQTQPSPKGSKSTTPKWKYDKSLSTTNELKRNDKMYYWCTGPGHQGKPMWAIHKPGTCTAKPNNNNNISGGTQPKGFNKQALTAQLRDKGLTDNEITSKLKAIVAIMES